MMLKFYLPFLLAMAVLFVSNRSLSAQPESDAPEFSPDTEEVQETTEDVAEEASETTEDVVEQTKDKTEEAIDYASKKSEEIAKEIDQSKEAQEYSAGILQPIYALAEYMSFSWFHWLAFTFMVSGVVSFALQLILGKLAVLAHGGFSLSQILTDAQGLVISIVGLFLTTQAATQNSTFTQSPAAVLSATAVGAIAGVLFYLWGQSEELQALRGRRELDRKESKS